MTTPKHIIIDHCKLQLLLLVTLLVIISNLFLLTILNLTIIL